VFNNEVGNIFVFKTHQAIHSVEIFYNNGVVTHDRRIGSCIEKPVILLGILLLYFKFSGLVKRYFMLPKLFALISF
jgi:hypothetical protein